MVFDRQNIFLIDQIFDKDHYIVIMHNKNVEAALIIVTIAKNGTGCMRG